MRLPGGVAREIDQDVDAVGAHPLGDGGVVEAMDRAPAIGGGAQALGDRVGAGRVGVAGELQRVALAIAALEQRFDEVGHRVLLEVR